MQVVLGKRGDYAIRAVLAVARQPDTRHKAREIAEQMAIPQKFLSRILADLVRAQILRATAGPTGGYELVTSADQLTLLEVIEAMDGPSNARDCLLRSTPCNSEHPCEIHKFWVDAEEAMLDHLRSTTFADVSAGSATITAKA